VTHRPITILNVFLDGRTRLKVGRLAAQNRRILFEYDPAFVATGLQLSPFRLPLRSGVAAGDPHVFDGLFGVFNDSLPDGWGRLLLDRAVEKLGIARHDLTPLDRLAHVGGNGMGSLSYEPDLSANRREPVIVKLEKIAREAAAVLVGEQGAVVEELLRLNGGSAGARPKVVVQVSADKREVRHGASPMPAGFAHWMVKFPAPQDDATVGPTEYAYSLMARAAGIEMPETHLFGAGKRRYFGTTRFDRDGDRRVHMHSLSGLLHADHRAPTLDYDGLLTATLALTKDATAMECAFRLACFNVLAHNRDDHAKNVSFLMDDTTGRWTLAPAYDLTFSSGPGGEQSMLVMGEGRAPGVEQLRALAKKHGMKKAEAVIDEVRAAISRWPKHADAAGLAKRPARLIADRIAPSTARQTRSKPKATSAAVAAKKKPTGTKRRKRPTQT
jgi:serine/threonine-protein kinase HipA